MRYTMVLLTTITSIFIPAAEETPYSTTLQTGWITFENKLYDGNTKIFRRYGGYIPYKTEPTMKNFMLYTCPKETSHPDYLTIIIPSDYQIKSFKENSLDQFNISVLVFVGKPNPFTMVGKFAKKTHEIFFDNTKENHVNLLTVMKSDELAIRFGQGDGVVFHILEELNIIFKFFVETNHLEEKEGKATFYTTDEILSDCQKYRQQ